VAGLFQSIDEVYGRFIALEHASWKNYPPKMVFGSDIMLKIASWKNWILLSDHENMMHLKIQGQFHFQKLVQFAGGVSKYRLGVGLPFLQIWTIDGFKTLYITTVVAGIYQYGFF